MQGSDERVPSIQSVFVEFYDAIDKGDISTAEKILTSLKEKLHENDPDIVGAETTLELEKMDI